MSWLWFALATGLVSPFVIIPSDIREAFREGMIIGLGRWFGSALIACPITVVVFWLAKTILGLP